MNLRTSSRASRTLSVMLVVWMYSLERMPCSARNTVLKKMHTSKNICVIG